MIRHENFPSRHVPARHVEVCLPPGYDAGDGRYPVLYMHDGQNCFNAADCGFGVAWEVQHALARLIAAGEARPAIIVGVWCLPGQQRVMEYRPARPFAYLSAAARAHVLAGMGGAPWSDAYLAFLVQELKPFIDATYRTRPVRDDTLVMGSSMGGLISLYALCEYPDVFGGAGCVSSHWPAVEGVIGPYLRERLPDFITHRLYFDHGTTTIDALYPPIQAEVDRLVAAAGYARDHNWQTLVFPGAPHNEIAWRARVHLPLRFLLGPAA